MLACTLSENVKSFGMNACLRPIVDELLNLWENGIFVKSVNYEGYVKVRFIFVSVGFTNLQYFLLLYNAKNVKAAIRNYYIVN